MNNLVFLPWNQVAMLAPPPSCELNCTPAYWRKMAGCVWSSLGQGPDRTSSMCSPQVGWGAVWLFSGQGPCAPCCQGAHAVPQGHITLAPESGEQMLFWVRKGSGSGRTQLGQGTFICSPDARSHTAKGDKYMEHPECRAVAVQLDLGKNLGFFSLLFV